MTFAFALGRGRSLEVGMKGVATMRGGDKAAYDSSGLAYGVAGKLEPIPPERNPGLRGGIVYSIDLRL